MGQAFPAAPEACTCSCCDRRRAELVALERKKVRLLTLVWSPGALWRAVASSPSHPMAIGNGASDEEAIRAARAQMEGS